jgi:hypothetical protein
VRSDNLDMNAVPEWVYRVDSPPATDDEPYQSHELERQTSRDTVLLCIAGMVIIAVLAYWAGSR